MWQCMLGVAITVIAGSAWGSPQGIPCEEGKRYYTLAREAGSTQDFAAASDWLRKSVAACDSYAAWHLLGTAYQKQRRLAESLDAYEQAVVHAPTRNQAALSMARYGTVLALNGQRFEALTMLERAIDTHASPPSWIREHARELDRSLAEAPVASESIKRSLASQEFGLLALNRISANDEPAEADRARVRIPINYKLDSTEMDELTRDNIEALGQALASNDYADRSFTLIGHTDVRGSRAYNLALSQRRAAAARDTLEARFPGLRGRLRVSGAGESRPRYPGEDLPESDHRLNRRLEVIVN